jgi:hypothetical protein
VPFDATRPVSPQGASTTDHRRPLSVPPGYFQARLGAAAHRSPGRPDRFLHHIEQLAAEIGPIKVIQDHDAGRSTVWHVVDLALLAAAKPGGRSAVDAAQAMFDTDKATHAAGNYTRGGLYIHMYI